MQVGIVVGILLLFALCLTIITVCMVSKACLDNSRPTTDKIYSWIDDFGGSARRLKLRYVSDHNVASSESAVSAGEGALKTRLNIDDEAHYDPTAEPELPFGRYGKPRYTPKEVSSLGLELWTSRMLSWRESLSIDKKCRLLFKEAKHELERIGLTIIDSQETSEGILYTADINASGYDRSINERVIVKIRIYGTHGSRTCVVEISVFSRDKEAVIQLAEQVKQALWQ